MEIQHYNGDEEQNEKRPSTGAKVAVLIILIILLIAGIILPIKFIPGAFSGISSRITSFFGPSKNIVVSSNTTETANNKEFVISWTGNTKTNGSYILNYPCVGNIRFETSISRPNDRVSCASDYYFSTEQNSITLKTINTKNERSNVPITLSFLENGTASSTVLGTVTINSIGTTASSTVATTTPAKPTPKPPVVDKESTSVPPTPQAPTTKPADLKVVITAIGILDSNGVFQARSQVAPGSRAAVRFVVSNEGGKTSGTWRFAAVLPTVGGKIHNATGQPAITAKSGRVYTLGFDNLASSTQNTVTISIYGDTNTANNTTSIRIPTIGF